MPERVRPGAAVMVQVGGDELPRGRIGKKPLAFFRVKDGWQAIGGVPLETVGSIALQVRGRKQELDVMAHSYPTAHLEVDPIYVDLTEEAKARLAEDNRAIASALQEVGDPLWQREFRWPIERRITSQYGEHRLFNGKKYSRHLGTDLGAPTGAPIGAANDGEVVLARDCFLTGNTVLIRHGAGIFTAYFHLSEIGVEVGQRVKQSDVIGQVGETGRTTGPHLHYAVRAGKRWVDPESFMALSIGAPVSEPRI